MIDFSGILVTGVSLWVVAVVTAVVVGSGTRAVDPQVQYAVLMHGSMAAYSLTSSEAHYQHTIYPSPE